MADLFIPKRNQRVKKEDLLINATHDTIVSSKRSRADVFLKKLKNSEFYQHNQNPRFDADFVEVVNLSTASPLHCDYQYIDAVINFAFPLFKNQFALYTVDNKTVGYLSWGWFSLESEALFFDPDRLSVDPDIVCSGSVSWIIDVIAPYGDVRATVKHATAVAKSKGVAPGSFKFQRNYTSKSARKNIWKHR